MDKFPPPATADLKLLHPCLERMNERDEDFLSREENEEEIFDIRGETENGGKFLLNSGLIHCHTVYQAAVTLSGNIWSDFRSNSTIH